MTGAPVSIGLILDHTALLAYDAPKLAPGETIREVWMSGLAIAVPTLSIAAAIARGADDMTILALLYEPAVQPVEHGYREIGRRARDFGGALEFGAAALAAGWYDAPVLTDQPAIYRAAGLMAVPLDDD